MPAAGLRLRLHFGEQFLIDDRFERHACIGDLCEAVDKPADRREQHRDIIRHKGDVFLELERAVKQSVVLEVDLARLLEKAERAERAEIVAVSAGAAQLVCGAL